MDAVSEQKRAHLRLIRTIANRMRVGSALVRLWSIATVAALIALATHPTHARYAWLALFMTLAFWALDAHFCRQARLFRKTYDRVLAQPESELDFDLSTAPVDSEESSFSSVFLSKALSAFYGTVIALIALVRLMLARGG